MANDVNYFMETDWREKVAAMTATNDQDIEKAFSDQASGFVENAVGDLMKDQHRVGFEIVKKNDNNTRMVGIFAFRVDNTVIYAIVFFLNGEIKGPILYRTNTKTFVPANKEWANYLIESIEMDEGKGRDRSRRVDSAPLVRMHDIAFLPPGMGKRASSDYERAYAAVDEEMQRAGFKNSMQADEYRKEFNKRMEKRMAKKASCECGTCCTCCCGQGKTINVPSKQKRLDAPAGDMTGEYEVGGMYTKHDQPELNTGESLFKCSHWDDGTVRIETAKGWVPMTREESYEIKRASEQGYSRIVIDGEVEHVLSKEAAAKVAEFIDEKSDRSVETLDACLEKIASFMEGKGIIKEFLKEPDFGQPAAEAIVKAAGKYEFASMLAGIYGEPKNFIPEQFNFTPVEKKAAANTGELAMYFDFVELHNADGYKESEAAEFFKSGSVLHDTRTDSLSVVIDSAPDMLSAPDIPGEYSILKSDGTFLENAFVAYAYEGPFGRESSDCGDAVCSSWHESRRKPHYRVFHDGKVMDASELLGFQTKSADKAGILKDSPVSKKLYYIFIPSSESVVGPIAIKEIKTVGGVKHCEAFCSNYYGSAQLSIWAGHHTHPITVNPDLDTSDLSAAVFGKDAKFIEVNIDRQEYQHGDLWNGGEFFPELITGVGSSTSLDNWIYSTWNVPKVKIEKFVESGKAAAFRIGRDDYMSNPMHRNTMLIKLAQDLRIPGEKAYELVECAEQAGKVEFFIEGMDKAASRLWLAERPNLDDEFDSEFGLPMVPEKKFILRVQGDQIQEEPSAIGDAMNPTTPTGLPNLTVTTAEPEQLQELADLYHLPNVFEHGVVSTLADTFNAVYLIDKYIPKLEDAVDVLGRIKFLIYWCPGDFEKAYGTDDMANFEAEIDANFEELGALLLKLLKKSEKQKKSNGNKQEEEKVQ